MQRPSRSVMRRRCLLFSTIVPAHAAAALAPEGIFVLESFASVALPESPLWEAVREKTYGSTRVSYLSPLPVPPATA